MQLTDEQKKDAAEAFKIATEAGREATKQIIVVCGGLLAGYLAFVGRPGTADILDRNWAKPIIGFLTLSLLLSCLSLGFTYAMHARRSSNLGDGRKPNDEVSRGNEWIALRVAEAAFGSLIIALLILMVTAFC